MKFGFPGDRRDGAVKKFRWIFFVLLLVLFVPAMKPGAPILGAEISSITLLRNVGGNCFLAIERTGDSVTTYRNVQADALEQYTEFDEAALAMIRAALAADAQAPEAAAMPSSSGAAEITMRSDAALKNAPAGMLFPEFGRLADGGNAQAVLIGFAGELRMPMYSGSPARVRQNDHALQVLGTFSAQEEVVLEEVQPAAVQSKQAAHALVSVPSFSPAVPSAPVRVPAGESVVFALVCAGISVVCLRDGGCPVCMEICRTAGRPYRCWKKARFRPLRVYSPGVI